MKYSKELHDRVRQNLRMFDYPRFDDGDIDTLLDEIERLQAERRWIPVSERLPQDGIFVLACSASNHSYIVKKKTYPCGTIEWEDICRSYIFRNVFDHWMPLPPPPELPRDK